MLFLIIILLISMGFSACAEKESGELIGISYQFTNAEIKRAIAGCGYPNYVGNIDSHYLSEANMDFFYQQRYIRSKISVPFKEVGQEESIEDIMVRLISAILVEGREAEFPEALVDLVDKDTFLIIRQRRLNKARKGGCCVVQ